jgi:hypothetical protein
MVMDKWGRVLAAIFVLAGTAHGAPLGPGDPAPKLVIARFLRGEPVHELAAGHLYVVEFWSTWSGPFRVSFPHDADLAEQCSLARRYPAVTFIGMDVWGQGYQAYPVRQGCGDTAYRMAADASGLMAEAWMQAAGQESVPRAFVIGADGRIAWIGHPRHVETVLAKVVKGQWDASAARQQAKLEAARESKSAALRAALDAAGTNAVAEVGVLRASIAADASMLDIAGPLLLDLLLGIDREAAAPLAARLVAGPFRDNAALLNVTAWSLVAPEPTRGRLEPELAEVALRAAGRADRLQGGHDPFVADTLARAWFRTGDAARAVEAESRAVSLAARMDCDDGPLRSRLAQYVEARDGLPPPRTHQPRSRPGSRM